MADDRQLIAAAGYRLAFWLAITAISIIALVPNDGAPTLSAWDKLNHLAAFFVLTGLALRAYPRSSSRTVVLTLLGYGGALELLQGASGYRFPSLLDIVANGLGIALYLALRVAIRELGMVCRHRFKERP